MNDINDNTITAKEFFVDIVICIAGLLLLNFSFSKIVWLIVDLGMIISDKL